MQTVNTFTSFLMLVILLLVGVIMLMALMQGHGNDRAYQAGLGERALIKYPRPRLVPAPMPAPVKTGRDGGKSHGIRTVVNSRGDLPVAQRPGKPPYGARVDHKGRLATGAHATGEESQAGNGVSTHSRTRVSRHGRAA